MTCENLPEDENKDEKPKKEKHFLMIPEYIATHSSLSAESKLLFGKIKALSNKKKFCWASNKSLAEYFNTTDRTIRRWLEDLKKSRLIKIEYKFREGTQEVESRHIFIVIPKSEKDDIDSEKKQTSPKRHHIANDNIPPEDVEKYLRRV